MRGAGTRLGPRGDDVEEQATDGDADRERVRQLDSPPSRISRIAVMCRMLDRGRSVTVRMSRIPRPRLSIRRSVAARTVPLSPVAGPLPLGVKALICMVLTPSTGAAGGLSAVRAAARPTRR